MRSMRAPIMRRSAIMSPNTDQGIFRQEILRSPALSRQVLRSPALSREILRSHALSRIILRSPALPREILRSPALSREILRSPALSRRILRSPALPREILRSPALSREILRSPALSRRILRKLVAPSRWKRRLSTQRAESPVSALAIAPSSRQLRLLRRRLSFGNAFRAPFVMSRRGFPLVPPSSAVLVVLLLVAAAAGGVRGLRGNAAHPRKLAVGGSGDSSRRRTAELVKESSHASAMGGAHIPPLQLILAEEGRAEGAVCLDGSAPGFYYRKGYGSGQNNWVLFFEGGAWCSSPHACAYRARMHLGSTKHARSVGEMLDRQNGSMHGMLSSNHTVNPGEKLESTQSICCPLPPSPFPLPPSPFPCPRPLPPSPFPLPPSPFPRPRPLSSSLHLPSSHRCIAPFPLLPFPTRFLQLERSLFHLLRWRLLLRPPGPARSLQCQSSLTCLSKASPLLFLSPLPLRPPPSPSAPPPLCLSAIFPCRFRSASPPLRLCSPFRAFPPIPVRLPPTQPRHARATAMLK
ncbi:unnamed protein product [Closterium sp. NIES-53]